MRLYGLLEQLTKIILVNGKNIEITPSSQPGSSDKILRIPAIADVDADQEIILSKQSQVLEKKTISSPIVDGTAQAPAAGKINLASAVNSLLVTGQNGSTATISTASLTGAKTFTFPDVSGTLITSSDSGSITSAMIANGTIVNEDINASAAIAGTKISPAFGNQAVSTSSTLTLSALSSAGVLHNDANGLVSSSKIVDADVDNAAAIQGSKVIPSFGAQNVSTTGSVTAGSLTLNGNVSLGVGASNALTVGDSDDTITIPGNLIVQGTTTTIDTTNLEVKDKNILLNNGGTTASAAGAGISVEGDSNAVIASIQYDAALASKFKLGAAGSEVQVADVSSSQTLLNKKISSTAALTGALELPAGTELERPGTPAEGMLRYNSDSDSFEGYAAGAWAGIGGGGTTKKVAQATHGLAVSDVVWLDVLDGKYKKAKADAANTAEVVGVVSRVVDAGNFELTLSGEVDGFTGLTKGEVYFLSAATEGAVTAVEPSVVGQVSVPVGVASSATTILVAPKRGVVVGSANVRTNINLSNNATTTVQNVSAYDAGELSGWVYIDATTDRRFYVTAQFAKKGDGTGYWCAFQTTGDTPPAGFSMDVTTTGAVHTLVATMPSVAGFSSANINFALNAPAVGATLPLNISPALISGAANIAMQSGYGISFGNETLKNYDEGTFTCTENRKTNLTGTGSFLGGNYTRIGNMVFATLDSISGYTITTAGNDTFLAFDTNGLPGLTNSTKFYGGGVCNITSSPFEAIIIGVEDDSGSNTAIRIKFGVGTGIGVSNGDAISISSLYFQYRI